MSLDRKTFQEICTRIKEKHQDDYDVDTLLNALDFDGEQYFLQVGNDNVYIGTARDIHYERIYQGNDPEIIEELIKVEKLLIKKFSDNLSSTELLSRFEVTDYCRYLLKNPNKIGYQSTFILLIIGVLIIISCLVISNFTIGLFYVKTNMPLFDFLQKIMGIALFLSIIFLGLVGFIEYRLIDNIKNVWHRKWWVKDNSVIAIPANIISLHFEKNVLTQVSFETNQKDRYKGIIPDFDSRNWILREGDIGVVYLKPLGLVYLKPRFKRYKTHKVSPKLYIMLDFIRFNHQEDTNTIGYT